MQMYWVWNVILEFKELLREKWDYFKDIWSYLDFTIIFGSQLFLSQLMIDLLMPDPYFKPTLDSFHIGNTATRLTSFYNDPQNLDQTMRKI